MDDPNDTSPPDGREATVLIPKIRIDEEELAHYLIVTSGPRQGARILVTEQPLLIGRSRKADIDLADPAVSGRHCSLCLVAGRLMVQDLGSSNGTYLDEVAVTEASQVALGSVLQVGSTLLKYELRNQGEIERLNQLSGELDRADSYVRSLLPPPLESPALSVRWRFIPSTKLGGDAFGYGWLDDDLFALYLLDVCGHGAGSALHSVSIINLLRRQKLPGVDFSRPEQVLTTLNDAFQMNDHGGMYFTLWYGVYRPSRHHMTFASAGHPPALLIGPGEKPEIRRLVTRRPAIGLLERMTYEAEDVEIVPGSHHYLYSDGAFEIVTQGGNDWDLDDFLSLLAEPGAPHGHSPEAIEQAVREIMKGNKFEDDFSLLVTEFR